ncbi:MAG: NUDIX hydrolase [Chloroflexota bacterium]
MKLLWRLWSLGWPRPVRRAAEALVMLPAVQARIFPRFLVGVVGVIRNDAGEFLVLHHTYRDRYPWGLPSGFLEHGEQPWESLRREVREEAGLDIEPGDVQMAFTDDHRPLLNLVLHAMYRGGSFTPSGEVSEGGFYPLDNLPPLPSEQEWLLERAAAMASER